MSLRRLLLIGAVAAPMLFGSTGSGQDLREEVQKGWELTPAQAAALEARLVANPEELAPRAQLLGYYFGQRRAALDKHAEHVLWFIHNAPESEVLDGPEASIFASMDPDGYMEAKKAWLRAIEQQPRNAVFLRHAAGFFTLSDTELSVDLLQRAESVQPANPDWAKELGQIHWRQARNPGGEPDPESAARALSDFERAYELSSASDQGYLLQYLGMAAFVAHDIEKARTYAESMLAAIPDDWSKGNRIHFGNLLLGRIALSQGDPAEAGTRLIAAGQTPGSPQLNSFGPDMALAKKLLEHGETRAVVRYLELCGNFWEMDRGRLKEWIVLIEAGRTPDFSFNLRF